MASLLESYKNRLAISEAVYAKAHNGEKLDNNRKLVVAKVLENINRFMNEAFENSAGVQRTDMGMFKKFTLNLTTVALPNLIANDLVIVHPMTSMSGYISYIKYTAGSNKGNTAQGKLLNDPFRLGDVDADYTSSKVTESKPAVSGDKAVAGTLNWLPLVRGSVEFVVGDATYRDDGEGNIYKGRTVTATNTVDANGNIVPAGTVINAGTLVSGSSIDYTTGVYSFTDADLTAATAVFANYVYDNVVVPQNDIPMVSAKMEALPLIAKARRVAVYYSQIAAFQAKTDYGMDLGDQLAEKAVGQLSYEIDTEVTNLLIANANEDADLIWSKTLPVGVSKSEHYEGFTEILEIARQKIYDATKRFAPNYLLCASNLLPVLTFIRGFVAAPAGQVNGPYFAGTLNGLRVYVTPNIAPGKFVVGVNGDDLMSSAAVYAPYMAIVPTQLLQYADGGTSQGFSTLYDLRMLNPDLLIAGRITA